MRYMLRGARWALTIYDVKGAVPLADFVEGARRHVFVTSHGVMTGGELMDSGRDVCRTARRELVDMWRDGAVPGQNHIVVLDEGTERHEDAYAHLNAACERVYDKFGMYEWAGETGIESYMRLESPTLRRVLADFPDARRPWLCDRLLAMEGKGPVEHAEDCWCDTCCERRR